MTLAALLAMATPAAAQTARASGTVRDTDGKAIKGATIRATNPEAYPPRVVSSSDDRGRWAIIGMRTGTYTFTVEAPGFVPIEAPVAIRVAGSSPLTFTLARDPGPIPGALPSNIQAQVAAANMLRDQGRLDQAITAYLEIREKHPKLSTVNMVIADAYRRRAAGEADPALRRGFLERAIDSYTELLKSDAGHERARTELERARAEAAGVSR
jgi:tetratricopeptide (TPR) repeat protein